MEFNWNTMKTLYDTGILKDRLDCKNYISTFFIPTTSATHVLMENGKPTIIQKDIMTDVYLNRFKDDIKTWYKKKTIPKKLICDISKPQLGDNFIIVSPQIKHKYQEYKLFSKQTREAVNIMLAYIKLIWADSDDAAFTYLLKWFANVIKGVKNSSCLYAKGDEGIGNCFRRNRKE